MLGYDSLVDLPLIYKNEKGGEMHPMIGLRAILQPGNTHKR